MPQLCDQLIELVGMPFGNSNPRAVEVLSALADNPIADYGRPNERRWFYHFPESGFSMTFNSVLGIFIDLSFYLIIGDDDSCEDDFLGPDEYYGDTVPDGAYSPIPYRPYGGVLPFGLERIWSQSIVEAKLPGSTCVGQYYRFDSHTAPLEVFVGFHPIGGGMLFITVFHEE